jgi:hypothetical protein
MFEGGAGVGRTEPGLVENGACPGYWELSLRRRMIRSLWTRPIFWVSLFFIVSSGHPTGIINYWPVALSVAASAGGIAYNYRRWKTEPTQAERSESHT